MKSNYEQEADRENYFFLKFTDNIYITAHYHKNVEMIFLEEGEFSALIDGKKYCVKAGEGVFVRPYAIHAYSHTPDAVKAWVLVLSDRYLREYRSEYCKDCEQYPVEHLSDRVANRAITDLLSAWDCNRGEQILGICGWVDMLFSRLLERYPLVRVTDRKSDQFPREALLWIDEHSAEDITLEKLAQALGYSRNYCSMLFNKCVGEGFSSYLNRIRAEKAAKLIEAGITADYAMRKVGFSSRSTFYRYYKK